MSRTELFLQDKRGRKLGTILVERCEGNLRVGKIVPEEWPTDLQEVFSRYEQLINDQVLSILDEVEKEIDAYGFRVSSGSTQNGEPITDLQITSDHRVSFRFK